MSTRVFQLAKELGVTSKMILDKCRAEGLELKNHMAALSAGLEATIREWFTEGASVTAVETAESVDIEGARKQAAAQRRRRRRKDDTEGAAEVELEEAETPEIDEEQAEPEELEEAQEADREVEEEAPEPEVVAEAPEAVVEEPELEPEQPVEEQPQAAEPVAAEAEPVQPSAEVEEKPAAPPKAEVRPAGPQLVPRPAQLQGPRVIRVERPDVIPTPRRQGPSYGERSGGGVQSGGNGGGSATPTPSTPKKRFLAASQPAAEEATPTKRRSPRRKGGRVAEGGEGLREWRDRDLDERRARLAAATGGGLRRHRASVKRQGDQHSADQAHMAEVEEPITIKSLSAATGLKSADLIKKLMLRGTMATVNQIINAEMAEALALECGVEVRIKRQKTAQEQLADRLAERKSTADEMRPPVVTFLGHVDHGKTSLLDRIRSESVVTTESGGITQHIGSYRYEREGRAVTFLDTPGHEAFTQMRARGANMTDVVVLVVAADDGVMPQTVEAINHAKAAAVPIVVALNKIDVPNANVNRVMGQLAEHDLQPREWGGQTEVIQTSAITGAGIDDLVEVLSLEAELLELKADPQAPARGSVIEAEMDPGRGVVARLLVRDGTLRVGDILLAGPGYGRVRQILDHSGKNLQEAPPSTPVEVSGLDAVPTAGDVFYVVDDLSEAKEVAEDYRAQYREQQLATKNRITLDNLFEQIASGNVSELPLIVKADVQGSVEVLVSSLAKLSAAEVRVRILHAAVGGVSTGDVLLAEASGAIILGFHVVPDSSARELADRMGVDIRLYRVIYQLIDEVKLAMEGLLSPEIKEQVQGHAEVRDVFKVSRVGTIAGCYITDGVINRNSKIRITRDNIVVEDERSLESLRRFKDDVREVRNGMECGIKIAGYNDVKQGDILEAYTTVEVARTL